MGNKENVENITSKESKEIIKEQCKKELSLACISGICSTNTVRFLLNLLDEKEIKGDNK